MATVNKAMWVEINTTPENMKNLLECDRIDLRIVCTDGECGDVIKTYTEKFVDRLCDE